MNPLCWAIMILLLSIGFRNRLVKNRLCWLALGILVFFTNPFMSMQVAKVWEEGLQQVDEVQVNGRPIVVLGGMAESLPELDRPVFFKAGDRLMGAMKLMKASENSTLVLSGGSLYGPAIASESRHIKAFLTNLGLFPERIVTEPQSTNTAQNARYCSDIFQQNNWAKDIILVSSGYHLHRARMCFEKQGFRVETFATDPLESRSPKPLIYAFIPSMQSLQTWETLLKEWLGLLYYRLKGEI